MLARGQGRVDFSLAKDVLEVLDGLASGGHLSLNGILEVPGKVLDLLNLLLKIAAESCQGQYHILFDLARLARLLQGELVIASQDVEGIVKTAALEEALRRNSVAEDSRQLG